MRLQAILTTVEFQQLDHAKRLKDSCVLPPGKIVFLFDQVIDILCVKQEFNVLDHKLIYQKIEGETVLNIGITLNLLLISQTRE